MPAENGTGIYISRRSMSMSMSMRSTCGEYKYEFEYAGGGGGWLQGVTMVNRFGTAQMWPPHRIEPTKAKMR